MKKTLKARHGNRFNEKQSLVKYQSKNLKKRISETERQYLKTTLVKAWVAYVFDAVWAVEQDYGALNPISKK